MFCNHCGQQLAAAAMVCAQCGHPVPAAAGTAPPPLAPAAWAAEPAGVKGRVERHVTIMAVLLLILGFLRLPGGLFLFGATSVHSYWTNWMGLHMGGIAGTFLGAVGLWLLVGAVLAIVAGVGLLQRAVWARMTALIAAFVLLPGFPLDTALGIYVLVILLGQAPEAEWAALSGARRAEPAGR